MEKNVGKSSHATSRSALMWSLLAALLLPRADLVHAQATESAAVSVSASADTTPVAADTAAPVTTDDEAAAEPESKLAWDLAHRRYNTWNGATGGLFLIDPSTGEVGAVRLALGLSTFSGDDFLLDKDHVEQDEQSLSLSVTATKVLELYASLGSRSTATSRPTARSLSTIGDITLGGKIGGRLAPVVYLGGDLRIAFANQIGGGGGELSGTSIGLRTEFALDFQELSEPVPFILRSNLGYYFDNSAKVVEDIEDARYDALNGSKVRRSNETRHLVDRFERFAMGLNRIDRASFGLGIEVPLEVMERFYLHPLVEWRLDLPVNRQGYNCPFVKSDPRAGSINSREDSCYERSSGSAFPMNLAVGLRAVPPIRGVSILLGAEFGLNSTTKFVRELSPTVPYRLLLSLSYDYDARPVAPVVVPAAAPVEKVIPVGRIQGSVTSTEGGPVDGAIVTFIDHAVSAVATSSDGKFVSEAFTAGEVQLEVNHPSFETGHCAATVTEGGGDVQALCTLTPKPRNGQLSGRVVDAYGSPVVGARITLSGPSSVSAMSDVRGNFESTLLTEGEYTVRAEADGHFVRFTKTNVRARETTQLELTLTPKPAKPSVTLNGQNIASRITFVGATTDLDANAAQSIAELADLLLTRSDLNVRVQGYGDDAVALSRALLIKQRLVDAGVADARIEAVGGGTGGRVVISVIQ